MTNLLLKLIAGFVLFCLSIAFTVVVGLLFAFLFQFIFNQTVAGYAGLPTMNFWCAWGLIVCAQFLKGSNVSAS